nr:glycosyltransferase [Helleborus thibetanus]
MTDKIELVMFPSVGLSHIIPTVEFAKRLIERDDRFSVTVLVITFGRRTPYAYIESVTNSVAHIRFIILPPADLPPPGTQYGIGYLSIYIQNHQPHVKKALSQLMSESSNSFRLVLDMFNTTMIGVAKELNVPSYVYITSGAGFLCHMLHLPTLDTDITTEFKDYAGDLTLPGYVNPVPVSALPEMLENRKSISYSWFLLHARMLRECKGIIVNSVAELELQAVDVFNQMVHDIPRVYLVGPIMNLEGNAHSGSNQAQHDRIMTWLDDQPESSVIFLCFGSRGTLDVPQVKELAKGLEQSGHRFLWSLRHPATDRSEPPSEYTNPEEVLPDGFLERVGGRGLICGWAPQVEILAHRASGAFASHCGWNSILESLWFGVPLLTWPLDAEQKLNAFQLVKDLGLAVEMKGEGKNLVVAEEVEKSVRCVMECESEVRRKVKEMSEKCTRALLEGGSSWSSLGSLVENLTTESVT